jgi:glutathione synthase
MIHHNQTTGDAPQIKQVEFNTIASSFAGLSTKVAEVHKRMGDLGSYPAMPQGWSPGNLASQVLADGIVEAHKAYEVVHTAEKAHKACVIFIVQDKESNVYDQRHLENLIWKQNVPVFRVVFVNILSELSVTADGTLLYQPPRFAQDQKSLEVSVVYYRAGYAPSEYQTADHWKARHLLETSRAVKCPTVLTQLAGTKKVQQALETPDQDKPLPGFHADRTPEFDQTYNSLKKTFVAMHAMHKDSELVPKLKDPAFAHGFVLKPQREGGGNNIYREDITDFVLKSKPEDLVQYILMEMIEPPEQRNAILRNGKSEEGNVICELGVYGAALWDVTASGGADSVNVRYNTGGGYLLRTKGHKVSEGGVAAGFGALDSVCLVEDSAIC